MKKIAIAALAAAFAAASCGFFVSDWDAFRTWTPWVRGIEVEGEGQQLSFGAVSVGPSDALYAVAGMRGGTRFTFGPSADIVPPVPGLSSAALLRYDRDGAALWARGALSGSSNISFNDVACDPEGNPVVCGSFSGASDFDLGDGVVERGGYANGTNFAVAKYDPDGNALWARAAKGGNSNSVAKYLATDGSGDIYCAGFLLSGSDAATYDFGGGVAVPLAPESNKGVVVKYNSSGTAQWARTLAAAPYYGSFLGIAADAEGNAYVSLSIGPGHPGTYDFGDGASFTMSGTSYLSFVVKYAPSGRVLWAAPVYGNGLMAIHGLRVAPDGNVLGCGAYLSDPSIPLAEMSFNGTALTLNPSPSMVGAMICKFAPDGAPLWARNVASPGSGSYLFDLDVDSEGRILASGYVVGPEPVDFGAGLSVAGAVSGDGNSLFAKYGADGSPLMAKTVEIGSEGSQFAGIAVDSSGNAYLAGCQGGQGDFRYGEGLVLAGTGEMMNAALVKYLGRQ